MTALHDLSADTLSSAYRGQLSDSRQANHMSAREVPRDRIQIQDLSGASLQSARDARDRANQIRRAR
jgi:hypothetical protein